MVSFSPGHTGSITECSYFLSGLLQHVQKSFSHLHVLWRQNRCIAPMQTRKWACSHKCIQSTYVCVHVSNDDVWSSTTQSVQPATAMRPHGAHCEAPAPYQRGDPPVGGQAHPESVLLGRLCGVAGPASEESLMNST